MRVERPRSFVIPSSREAVSTVSPWTVYSSRRAEPTLQDMNGPLLRPIPIPKPSPRPLSRSQRLKRGRRTSGISRAAAMPAARRDAVVVEDGLDALLPLAALIDERVAQPHAGAQIA